MMARALLILCVTALGASAQDWAAHRGGPERKGCVDGKAGPAAPKILWSYASKEHFLAPPALSGDRLAVVALGAFNTGSLRVFEAASGKPAWNKSAPVIRLPTVGTPAVAGGTLYFGEGMHQTDGSSLHAMRAADGRSLWRLDVPGELVHIEASPTAADGRVYFGAGSGGVVCVDLNKVSLDGKDMTLAEGAAAVDAKWKAMSDAYEIDKKKDPDFAIPPNEAALPRPSPKVLWEKGKGAWHVDAPLLVADGKVYVASAFLEKEKMGERALICLNAADGAELWKTPLKFNGWGGATKAGDLLLVPCSSMRYDPKEIPTSKGEVLALKLDGSVAWRRETPAVLATVAAAGDVAIVCDVSGEVRALDLKSGAPKWTSKAAHPYFAGPAVAGDAVYVADLEGGLRALGLADGKARWSLDLGAELKAPGLIYGSPAVHGGRVYVATSNLEGPHTGGATAVVCVGEGK
ncbi:MAG TPA: PQQ-binding-like beta-propeller repeat protein [Planctomycetota bacterium]